MMLLKGATTLALLLVTAIAQAASAPPQFASASSGGRVTLAWFRAPGAETCPDREAATAAIEAHLGTRPFGEGGAQRLTVTVSRDAAWRAHLQLSDHRGTVGQRQLTSHAPDCGPLFAAVALAAALVFEAVDEREAPPLSSVESAAPSRRAVTTTSWSAAEPPPPPAPRAARPPSPRQRAVQLHGSAALDAGWRAAPRLGAEVGATFTPGRFGWGLGVLYLEPLPSPYSASDALSLTAATLSVRTDLGRSGPLTLRGQSGFAVGVLSRPAGPSDSTPPPSLAWGALTVGLSVASAVTETWYLQAGARAVIPLSRAGVYTNGAPEPFAVQNTGILGHCGVGTQFF